MDVSQKSRSSKRLRKGSSRSSNAEPKPETKTFAALVQIIPFYLLVIWAFIQIQKTISTNPEIS